MWTCVFFLLVLAPKFSDGQHRKYNDAHFKNLKFREGQKSCASSQFFDAQKDNDPFIKKKRLEQQTLFRAFSRKYKGKKAPPRGVRGKPSPQAIINGVRDGQPLKARELMNHVQGSLQGLRHQIGHLDKRIQQGKGHESLDDVEQRTLQRFWKMQEDFIARHLNRSDFPVTYSLVKETVTTIKPLVRYLRANLIILSRTKIIEALHSVKPHIQLLLNELRKLISQDPPGPPPPLSPLPPPIPNNQYQISSNHNYQPNQLPNPNINNYQPNPLPNPTTIPKPPINHQNPMPSPIPKPPTIVKNQSIQYPNSDNYNAAGNHGPIGRRLRRLLQQTLSNVQYTDDISDQGNAYFAETTEIVIPVVVHVLVDESKWDVTDEQVESQIDSLNADFSKLNTDVENAGQFEHVAAAVGISFKLDHVTRTNDPRLEWGLDDAMKRTELGGVPPVDPEGKLNIWVCRIAQVEGSWVMGYAQFPGGHWDTDGVVLDPTAFGTTGTAVYPSDLGRTASHEVGHYLDLDHVWGEGDGGCHVDDGVLDTPNMALPHSGCPLHEHSVSKSCGEIDMSVNFMDYVQDSCMCMFTEGQKLRMRALFEMGGLREKLGLSSIGSEDSADGGVDVGSSVQPLCDSKALSNADEFIDEVQLVDMFSGPQFIQSGAGDTGYQRVNKYPLNVTRGYQAVLVITPVWTDTVYAETFTVWIDLDGDSTLNPETEVIFHKNLQNAADGVTVNFTLPPDMSTGLYWMRVQMSYSTGDPDPCSIFPYGEVEDYLLSLDTDTWSDADDDEAMENSVDDDDQEDEESFVSACAGICGKKGVIQKGEDGSKCYCDGSCMKYGDCCKGYEEMCLEAQDGDDTENGYAMEDTEQETLEALPDHDEGGSEAPPDARVCEGFCGQKNGILVEGSSKKCYCDTSCLKYDDCCKGYETVCGNVTSNNTGAGNSATGESSSSSSPSSSSSSSAAVGSCSGKCGSSKKVESGKCYCDAKCKDKNDCCGDYVQQCEGDPLAQ